LDVRIRIDFRKEKEEPHMSISKLVTTAVAVAAASMFLFLKDFQNKWNVSCMKAVKDFQETIGTLST
jgi:hypothetical protein